MPAEQEHMQTCRRDAGSILSHDIKLLAGSGARVNLQRERPWASITFAGTRYCFTVDWGETVHPDAVQNLATILPDHEFAIPRHFIADILVTERSENRLQVELLSIIDPVENAWTHEG